MEYRQAFGFVGMRLHSQKRIMKPFAFAKPQNFHVFALQAHSDICEASGYVFTTEPLGFVLTKQVNDFLLRVYALAKKKLLPIFF